MALQNLEHSQKLWGQRQFDKVRGGLTNFVPMVKNENDFVILTLLGGSVAESS